MRNILSKMLLVMVFIFILAVISACGNSNNDGENSNSNSNDNDKATSNEVEKTLKITHVGSEDHVLNLSSIRFKEEVEEMSEGRIEVEIYPAMQLGGETDMMEQMKNGSLDISLITAATLSSRSESFNAWFMPYLFDDIDSAYEMMNSEIGQEILNSLSADEGVVPLGYSMIPPRHISSPHKIETMNDFKGKKIRITPAQVISDFFEELDVSPTAMEQQEIYNALQSGVMDGMDSDLESVIVNRFYEIADYLNLTRHYIYPMGVLFSEKVWNELSEEDQEIVQNAVEIATEFYHDYVLES